MIASIKCKSRQFGTMGHSNPRFLYSEQVPQMLVVLCTYADFGVGSAGLRGILNRATELMCAGYEVYVVTEGGSRDPLEGTVAPAGVLQPTILYWSLPKASAFLRRWSWGRRMLRYFWYVRVHHLLDDWRAAVGMRVVRRLTYRHGSSITYLAFPDDCFALGKTETNLRVVAT
jgi:hypothetical protein